MKLSLCTSGPYLPKLAGQAAGVGVGLSDTPMVYQQDLKWEGRCAAPYTWGTIRNNGGCPELAGLGLLEAALTAEHAKGRFLLDYEPDPNDDGCERSFRTGEATDEIIRRRAYVYEWMSHYADSLYAFPRTSWKYFPAGPMDRIMRRLPFLAPCAYWYKGWTARDYYDEQMAYRAHADKYGRLRDIKPLFTFTYSGGGGPVTVGHCGHMNQAWSFCEEGLLWFAVDTEAQADAAIALMTAERIEALRGNS